jgi:hypothetical protein
VKKLLQVVPEKLNQAAVSIEMFLDLNARACTRGSYVPLLSFLVKPHFVQRVVKSVMKLDLFGQILWYYLHHDL